MLNSVDFETGGSNHTISDKQNSKWHYIHSSVDGVDSDAKHHRWDIQPQICRLCNALWTKTNCI